MPLKPLGSITEQIENKSFNLAFHSVFEYNPSRLANIEFERVKELINRQFDNHFDFLTGFDLQKDLYTTLFHTKQSINEIEENIKDELQKIAEDTIREIYGVPSQIKMKSEITEDIDFDFKKQKPLLKKDISENLKKEIDKRIVLNALSHGSSMHIWKSVHWLVKDEVDKLSPELFNKYNDLIALTSFVVWQQDLVNTGEPTKWGQCSIGIDSVLNAKAMCLPILLMELNKSVFEYLTLRAVPKNLSSDELDIYYAVADNYEHEMWHQLLSPTLYTDWLKNINVDPTKIPKKIEELCDISPDEIEKYFIKIQN